MQIKHPEWLQIKSNEDIIYGLNQIWYTSSIKRLAGCGPTCATSLLLYLNKRDSGALPYINDDIPSSVSAMEDVWRFITPGIRGLDSTIKFVTGMDALLLHHGAPWKCHALNVQKNGSIQNIIAFIKEGIASDCPIAFLNLHVGGLKEFDEWHWIVIIGIDNKNDHYIATAYDEGRKIEFDIGMWIEATKKGGGFVYLT